VLTAAALFAILAEDLRADKAPPGKFLERETVAPSLFSMSFAPLHSANASIPRGSGDVLYNQSRAGRQYRRPASNPLAFVMAERRLPLPQDAAFGPLKPVLEARS
jgi:hypothetical protein